MTDLPAKGRKSCYTCLLWSHALSQAVLVSSVAPQQAELICHHETQAAETCWARLPLQAGEGIPPSPRPSTPHLLLPFHHTQNTFHTSVGFNLSWDQMDPGKAYTDH